MYSFIFPCDYFNSKKPDEAYEHEYNAFKDAGYSVHLINVDELDNYKIYPPLEGSPLIYRGWMLSEENYEKLNKKTNDTLVVKTEDYLKSHHLPGWYENIKEFTIESAITTEQNAPKAFSDLGWNKAFMKDYVKSLKTGKGSIVDSPEDVQRALADIYQFKGFVEKGIVFRRVMDFALDTETRFFVLDGKIFSNSDSEEMKSLVEKVAQKHSAFFYSVDVIKDKNDKLHVIEIGDGQVSDTVGWDLNNFVDMFNSLKNTKTMKP